MRKFIVLALLLIPLSTRMEKTTLPVSAYARVESGVIKASSIWFNLPRHRRLYIIDSLYTLKDENNYETTN